MLKHLRGMIMFLSQYELEALTDYKYACKQIEWLKERGYKYDVAANGRPKVLKMYVLDLFGWTSKSLRKKTYPNFKAVEGK